MLLRPQEIVFKEFEKLKEIEAILKLMKRGHEPITSDFFLYILRHILAKKMGEGIKLKKGKNYSIEELKKQFLGF
ncbi:MAG: hypothetical protein PHW50_03195, partial [Patescibacteria group bacterium]|nr:hypothetical protein [Patescibacteria group bacterium]